VKLTVDGKTYTQSLNIKMDPRVKTSLAGLRQQFELESKIGDAINRDYHAVQQVHGLGDQVKALQKNGATQLATDIAAFEKKLADLEGTGGGYGAAFLSTPQGRGLARLNAGLVQLLGIVDSADVPPTTQAAKMFSDVETALDQQLATLKGILSQELPALNEKLKQAGVAPLKESAAALEEKWGSLDKATGEE
jgi:hypothetical protein